MRFAQAWVIARHDMGLFRRRKSILYVLIGFPLGVSIGFSALVGYILSQGGSSATSYLFPVFVDAFSFWFVIGAASLPTAIAAYGIAGEKVEKSLEPLLATPTSDGEILLGKVLSAFVPTILAVWVGGVLYMGLIDLETRGVLGYLYFPNVGIAVTLFVLAPIACLFAIEVTVLISSRVTDVRGAQQASGVVFLPFIFLYVLGEVGPFPLNATNSLYVAGALAGLVLLLFGLNTRIFQREEILTRWK